MPRSGIIIEGDRHEGRLSLSVAGGARSVAWAVAVTTLGEGAVRIMNNSRICAGSSVVALAAAMVGVLLLATARPALAAAPATASKGPLVVTGLDEKTGNLRILRDKS